MWQRIRLAWQRIRLAWRTRDLVLPPVPPLARGKEAER